MPRIRSRKLFMMLTFFMAVFALQAPFMLAPAPPAAAEANDHSGGTGGAGGNSGTGGTNYCSTNNQGGYRNNRDHFLAPFPGCFGHRSYNLIASCPVGFDVWRFYGNEANPTMATTVSRVNLPNWCQKNRTYRYFLPNPQDTGWDPAGPWRAATFTNDYGERVAIAESGPCGDVRGSLSCFATSDLPYRFMVNGIDSRDFTCANLQSNDDSLSKYFSGAYMDPNTGEYEAGSAVRRAFLGIFANWQAQLNSTSIALSAINSAGPPPNGAGNGDDIRYNDGIDCSSALDFVTSQNNPNATIMGECVMPINRMARAYTGGTYAYYNLKYNSRLGATRYTNEYRGAANGQRGGAYEAWRGMIHHEIRTRGGTLGAEIPAQPYDFDSGSVSHNQLPVSDRNAAADAARDGAYCFRGASSTYSDATSVEQGVVADSLIIRVNAPEVFQVGGSLHPGTVTTDSAVLMCGAQPCNHARNSLHPTIASLTYTLDLTGVNFQKCSSSRQAGCEYFIQVPAQGNANGQKVTGWFYSGTNPDQKVQVTLHNVSATQQVYKRSTSQLTTCTPSSSVGGTGGGGGGCRTIPIIQNLKDGPPRPVAIKAQVGSRIFDMPGDGVILDRQVVGAVGAANADF